MAVQMMTQMGKVNSPFVPIQTWWRFWPASKRYNTGTPIKVIAVKKNEIQAPILPNAAWATSS